MHAIPRAHCCDLSSGALVEQMVLVLTHKPTFFLKKISDMPELNVSPLFNRPNLTEITSSFESIGHIAHLNLRDKQLPFKKLIGQIILDKNKHITSVVNKLSSIDTTFRFFKMELIAGEDKMETEVKECGCRYVYCQNAKYA